MKFKHRLLLVVLTLGFVTYSYSQHRTVPIKNGFAIGGGITNFDVITDNFETTKGSGWIIHASATGDISHRWYNVSYGMQLSQSSFEIAGSAPGSVSDEVQIEYKVFSAQLGLLGHAKLFDGHFTIDAGPMLQYIGKLELENKSQETYILKGYDALTADAITDIASVQLNGAIGATVGFGPVKLRAQYIYGITNMFNRLNDQDLNTAGGETEFKGNQSMLAFMALFTF